MTIDSSGRQLRSENRGENLLETVDKVVATIDRQIERHKGRLYDRRKGSLPSRTIFSDKTETAPPGVVKFKRFAVKPISVAETIEQMEMLGYDFFLFLNVDNEELNLLYQRKYSNYGLIEPELG